MRPVELLVVSFQDDAAEQLPSRREGIAELIGNV